MNRYFSFLSARMSRLNDDNKLSCVLIPWRSILLVEETGVPSENHLPIASHGQTLSHNVVSRTPRQSGIRIQNANCDRHLLHMYL